MYATHLSKDINVSDDVNDENVNLVTEEMFEFCCNNMEMARIKIKLRKHVCFEITHWHCTPDVLCTLSCIDGELRHY